MREPFCCRRDREGRDVERHSKREHGEREQHRSRDRDAAKSADRDTAKSSDRDKEKERRHRERDDGAPRKRSRSRERAEEPKVSAFRVDRALAARCGGAAGMSS